MMLKELFNRIYPKGILVKIGNFPFLISQNFHLNGTKTIAISVAKLAAIPSVKGKTNLRGKGV